jgi:hypothetical protein
MPSIEAVKNPVNETAEGARALDPADPVKYDFAFHRMGLWKRKGEIDSLR